MRLLLALAAAVCCAVPATAAAAPVTGPTVAFGDDSPADGAWTREAVTYSFSSADPTAELYCSITLVELVPCPSGRIEVGPPTYTEGGEIVRIRARSAAGVWGPQVKRLINVDTTAPKTKIAGPAVTTLARPKLWFTVSDSDLAVTPECRLDGEQVPCARGAFVPAEPLAAAKHTLTVAHTDRAGNVEDPPASFTFTVEPPPPADPPAAPAPPPEPVEMPVRPAIGIPPVARPAATPPAPARRATAKKPRCGAKPRRGAAAKRSARAKARRCKAVRRRANARRSG